jgi:hypothetical protein
MKKMRKFVFTFFILLSYEARAYEPVHRVFVYPKIGFSSNLSSYTAFMIGPNITYRLSVLKGLSLSWDLLYLYSSVDKKYGEEPNRRTYNFKMDTFAFKNGLFYEIPYELTEGLFPYGEGGIGFYDVIVEGNAPDYSARDAFITWGFYMGTGAMYRLGKGLISGGIRFGYAPLDGGSPVKVNMNGFQLFIGYVYEF